MASKRFTSAQARLKRMQELLAPYTPTPQQENTVSKNEWIPGEYADLKIVEPGQPPSPFR